MKKNKKETNKKKREHSLEEYMRLIEHMKNKVILYPKGETPFLTSEPFYEIDEIKDKKKKAEAMKIIKTLQKQFEDEMKELDEAAKHITFRDTSKNKKKATKVARNKVIKLIDKKINTIIEYKKDWKDSLMPFEGDTEPENTLYVNYLTSEYSQDAMIEKILQELKKDILDLK